MRYGMWPRAVRWKRKPPRGRRLVRKRRPHRTARDRLRTFGLSRFRYLLFIPVLILMIAIMASVRVPRATRAILSESAGRVEIAGAEGLWVRSAKWRTSIPAGYRLAVDVGWERGDAPNPPFDVELLLKAEAVACAQKTALPEGALSAGLSTTRLELDIPYDLKGNYRLEIRISAPDEVGGADAYEAVLGALRVY